MSYIARKQKFSAPVSPTSWCLHTAKHRIYCKRLRFFMAAKDG